VAANSSKGPLHGCRDISVGRPQFVVFIVDKVITQSRRRTLLDRVSRWTPQASGGGRLWSLPLSASHLWSWRTWLIIFTTRQAPSRQWSDRLGITAPVTIWVSSGHLEERSSAKSGNVRRP